MFAKESHPINTVGAISFLLGILSAIFGVGCLAACISDWSGVPWSSLVILGVALVTLAIALTAYALARFGRQSLVITPARIAILESGLTLLYLAGRALGY